MKTSRDQLDELVTRIAGLDAKRRAACIRLHSAFTTNPETGAERVAETIEEMSDRWVDVTLDRVRNALREGTQVCIYDEHGVRVQQALFGD